MPRSIGIEVSGTAVAVGYVVFVTADWADCSSAGASDRAIMDHWFAVPAGLDLTLAAALPMALDTAHWHLTRLGLSADQTIRIHGAASRRSMSAGN